MGPLVIEVARLLFFLLEMSLHAFRITCVEIVDRSKLMVNLVCGTQEHDKGVFYGIHVVDRSRTVHDDEFVFQKPLDGVVGGEAALLSC